MNYLIDRYIENLIKSSPDKPLWNIEALKFGKKLNWSYIDGCMMSSLLALYKTTNNKEYLNYVVNFIDYFVEDDGKIKNYDISKYSTDDISESRVLFDLFDITGNAKYEKAIFYTYEQIKKQPRTKEGNFWHKAVYPNQVWLDGLYMAQPFYTLYDTRYNKMGNYHDITNQFKNVEKIMKDPITGLFYHGYDSSKTIFWADKKTGLSKNFWLRSIGWFVAAIVDVLSYMNEVIFEDYHYLKVLLKESIDNILKFQDEETKMFYQVVNYKNKKGNYLESSGSLLISYSILKGARLGYLPERYKDIGLEIFNGVCKKYLKEDNKELSLDGICLVAGLGPNNNRRRDGSYQYYISEPIVKNDAKGVGPLIMAYTETILLSRE